MPIAAEAGPVALSTPWRPECPRCGYDQSGAVASWVDTCPLAGTCPECGLDFGWGELHRAVVLDQHVKYEFSRHRARSLLFTWQASLRPWHFWSWMRLIEPVNTRRLIAYAVLATLVSYVVASLLMLVVWLAGPCLAWYFASAGPRDISRHAGHAAALDVWLLGVPTDRPRGRSDPWQWRLVLLVWVVLLPLTYRLIGQTLARTSIRPGHVRRINIYTLTTAPFAVFGFFALATLFLAVAWFTTATLGRSSGWRITYRDDPLFDLAETIVRRRWMLGTLWLALWLVLCQGFALKRYLKIPHAWFVACTLTFVAFLGALACVSIAATTAGDWLSKIWLMF